MGFNQITIILIYLDTTTFCVGGFPDMSSAQKWIDIEKSRPYWISSTQVQITDWSTDPPTVTIQ